MTATAPAQTVAAKGKWSRKNAPYDLRNLAAVINSQRIEFYPRQLRKSDFQPGFGKPMTTPSAPEPEVINGVVLLPPDALQVPQGPGGTRKPGRRRHEPERLTFLKGLGPVQLIAKQSKNGARAYAGFVFQTPAGQRIAILDSDVSENAMYIFDADAADWLTVARKKKSQILASGHPAFQRRIFHQNNWKRQVQNLLGKN